MGQSQPDKMRLIECRSLAANEEQTAITFLRQQGYSRSFGQTDQFFIAETQRQILGAVRLAREEGVLVLRGMRIRSNDQRQGIGTQLLNRLARTIQSEACYCIPYRWLILFYERTGFREIAAEEAPAFLVKRRASYLTEGLDVVLMRRPAN